MSSEEIQFLASKEIGVWSMKKPAAPKLHDIGEEKSPYFPGTPPELGYIFINGTFYEHRSRIGHYVPFLDRIVTTLNAKGFQDGNFRFWPPIWEVITGEEPQYPDYEHRNGEPFIGRLTLKPVAKLLINYKGNPEPDVFFSISGEDAIAFGYPVDVYANGLYDISWNLGMEHFKRVKADLNYDLSEV